MKSEPRNVLRDLLRDRGPELETNPQRVRALLTDLCPECRKEINLIVQAQQIDVPGRLKQQTAHLPVAVVLPTLSRLMEDHYGTSSEPARWAVESWAVALGMALPTPQPAPTPPPVTPQPTRAPVTAQSVPTPPTATAAIPTSAFWTLPYGEPVWVEIPAGEFWMGGERYSDEKPVHRVYLERYWIAKTPVTNAQYRFFVEATKREATGHWENGKIPPGLDNHPVWGNPSIRRDFRILNMLGGQPHDKSGARKHLKKG
jgi:formylglycine-generating enzyme required for sulfatase activity